MTRALTKRQIGDIKRAIGHLADSVSEIAQRPEVETWFAEWLRPHVRKGETAGTAWLVTAYRVPLHIAVRRESERYMRNLLTASPAVTDRERLAFEMVEKAYQGGFLGVVETQLNGLHALLVESGQEPS
jgi:hypothetical protein